MLANTKEPKRTIGRSFNITGTDTWSADKVGFTGKNGTGYTNMPAAVINLRNDLDANKVQVYSYNYIMRGDLKIKKTDSYGKGVKAKYRLENKLTGQYYEFETDANGNFTSENNEAVYNAFSLLSDSDHVKAFTDKERSGGSIPYGKYTLTELSTENGVQLLANPVTLTIPMSKTGEELADSEGKYDMNSAVTDNENGITYFMVQSLEIQNAKVLSVPASDGGGYFIFITVGITAAAGFWILLNRKQQNFLNS